MFPHMISHVMFVEIECVKWELNLYRQTVMEMADDF